MVEFIHGTLVTSLFGSKPKTLQSVAVSGYVIGIINIPTCITYPGTAFHLFCLSLLAERTEIVSSLFPHLLIYNPMDISIIPFL